MRRCWIVCLLAVVSLLAGGCRRQSQSLDSRLGEGVYGESIPVETLKLERRDFEDRFDASGVVEAQDEVTVSSEIAERIVTVHREIGDRVAAGDLLVSLNTQAVAARIRKLEAQLARAETQLYWARRDLKRQRSLFDTQVVAERSLDEATRLVDTSEDDVTAARAELELARVDLDRCEIRSPIAGAVSRRHVAVGEYVTPGVRLYDVVATERVKFVFSLAEKDVIGVRPNQTLEVEIDAYSGSPLRGTIRAISPAGSRETRTFRVEAEIVNGPERSLMPGMSGRARVLRKLYEDVYLLPEPAILRDGSSSYIYLANDAHARRIDVEILSQVGATAVVAGNFESQYECIIVGQAAVSPGAQIRVRRAHESIPEVRFE